MKKILLISVIALIALSCKKEPGTVTGVVTYFFNDYQGYKPDLGAKIYLTTDSCDTINEYLRVCKMKDNLEINKSNLKDIQSYKDENDSDVINGIIKSNLADENLIKKYAKDTTEFKDKEGKAFHSLHRIIDNPDTYNTTVDASGIILLMFHPVSIMLYLFLQEEQH